MKFNTLTYYTISLAFELAQIQLPALPSAEEKGLALSDRPL